MNTDDEIQRASEAGVRAGVRLVIQGAMDLLYVDGHQWSKRPCSTCRALTGLLGFDFGCVRYAKERASRED